MGVCVVLCVENRVVVCCVRCEGGRNFIFLGFDFGETNARMGILNVKDVKES